MRKRNLAFIVVLIAVAAFASAGPIADMLDPARGSYSEIKRLCEGEGCELGEAELNSILDRHPNSRYISRAENLVAECYWEQALHQETYTLGIEKAEIVCTRFPDVKCAPEARDFAIRRYEAWGNSLAEEGDYEGAVEKLQTILDKYPDYEYTGLVRSDIVRILSKKAAGHKADGDYDKAMVVYDRILAEHIEGLYEHEVEDVEEEAVRCLLEWGEKLRGEGRYDEAVERYSTIVEEYTNIYLLDLHDESQEIAEEEMADSLHEWATSLKEAGDYGKALEKYLEIVEELPETSCWDAALDAVPETCHEWAYSLEEGRNYSEALDKYILLLERYSGYPYPSEYKDDAEEAVPRVILSWGISLENGGNYQEALERYSLIIDEYSEYPYPAESASKAEDRIPGCYYSWASDLIAEGRYPEGLEKYSKLLEEFPYSGLASEGNSTLLRDMPAELLFNSAAEFKEAEKYNTAIMLYRAVANYHPESVYADDATNAAIDTEIEKIYKEEHGTLPPPYASTGKHLGGKCEVTIVNDVPYELTILISGPTNMSITIHASPGSTIRIIPPLSWAEPPEAAERATITIPPGEYRIAARVREPGIIPFYGEWTLESDNSYQSWFFLMRKFG